MGDKQSKFNHLTPKEYNTKPWKNGKGQTKDIFLLPEGADHSNFDLRFALSPILEKGAFSSFPGADRVITLIEGAGLNLEFEASTTHLTQFQSLYFDTGLAPMGEPVGGPVQVVNVMARRGVWKIETCKIITELDMSCEEGELIFLFALIGDCFVSTSGVEKRLKQNETIICSGVRSSELGREIIGVLGAN